MVEIVDDFGGNMSISCTTAATKPTTVIGSIESTR